MKDLGSYRGQLMAEYREAYEAANGRPVEIHWADRRFVVEGKNYTRAEIEAARDRLRERVKE